MSLICDGKDEDANNDGEGDGRVEVVMFVRRGKVG